MRHALSTTRDRSLQEAADPALDLGANLPAERPLKCGIYPFGDEYRVSQLINVHYWLVQYLETLFGRQTQAQLHAQLVEKPRHGACEFVVRWHGKDPRTVPWHVCTDLPRPAWARGADACSPFMRGG
jgi:hypothetical protein